MNYLAHIYLSDNTDKNTIGNLLGDFVSKAEDNNFEKPIREGIFTHRMLDSFTDSHPIFLMSKKRISTLNRRYAGLLIDMFYDHFLAKNWSSYSTMSLEEYTTHFYSILESFSDCLPDRLLNVMPSMVKENWLLSYKEITGIEKALERISKKLSIPNHFLLNSINELTDNYEGLESDFKSFFPYAIEYANQLKLSNK
ncbi:MAG: ACP phosphodiesterase [Clostridia bacterium]|nr:ACP phosphodiesterase [Clostridia bacterium]